MKSPCMMEAREKARRPTPQQLIEEMHEARRQACLARMRIEYSNGWFALRHHSNPWTQGDTATRVRRLQFEMMLDNVQMSVRARKEDQHG